MRIEFLGTGGFHPNERRHTACIYLPELDLAFDAGTSVFRLSPRLASPELNLFLSHAHLDHVVGLTYLLVPKISGQLQKLTIYGTEGTLTAVREHLFHPAIFPVEPYFDCHTLSARGSLSLAKATVSWQTLNSHPGGSLAFRVNQSRTEAPSVAYVTDTQVDGSYTDFIRGVDLLIHECYFADGREELAARTGHSCASEVVDVAQQAQVKRLILVHLDPETDSDEGLDLPRLQRLFPNVAIAHDEMLVEIP